MSHIIDRFISVLMPHLTDMRSPGSNLCRVGVIKTVIVINCNLITFFKIITRGPFYMASDLTRLLSSIIAHYCINTHVKRYYQPFINEEKAMH